jgi:enoyl-CoA hydratase/carnithine racemase
MSGSIEVEKNGPIAILRFGNPNRGLMDAGTEGAFDTAFDAVEQDEGIRVAILTGREPGMFIRHFDLALLSERGAALAAKGKSFSTERPVPETNLHRTFRRIEQSPKPYICAINGTAMGGGFEIALCCDFRLAQDGPYALGQPEINAGVIPGAGGTQRLVRLIGMARALDLLLTGRTVTPREALALGMLNECVEGPVLERALALAKTLAAKPPRAVAHIKRLVHLATSSTLDDGLAAERTLFLDLLVSGEARSRMAEILDGKREIQG